MTEKCENCGKIVIPNKKEYKCDDEDIIDYRCPECGSILKTVTIEK